MSILIVFSYLIFYGPKQLPILTHNAKIYADLIINLLLLATGCVKISEEKACWNFPFFPSLLCLTLTETWESNYLLFLSNNNILAQLISALNFVFLSPHPCH